MKRAPIYTSILSLLFTISSLSAVDIYDGDSIKFHGATLKISPILDKFASENTEILAADVLGKGTITRSNNHSYVKLSADTAPKSKKDWVAFHQAQSASLLPYFRVGTGPAAYDAILFPRVYITPLPGFGVDEIADDYELITSWETAPAPTGCYILNVKPNHPENAFLLYKEIEKDPRIKFSQPDLTLNYQKKATPDDPLIPEQWHFVGSNYNISIGNVWDFYRGNGINIGIADDALQTNHPDLVDNARTDIDYDYYDSDADPSPVSNADNHGTFVGGIAAARGFNAIGGIGVAPEAGLVGIRWLQPFATQGMIDSSIEHNIYVGNSADQVHVHNNSWGAPANYTNYVDDNFTELALLNGIAAGRSGLGTIYLFAAGNENLFNASTDYESYVAMPETIAVGALLYGYHATFSTPGMSLNVCAPGDNMASADRTGVNGYNTGDYTVQLDQIGGTSFSSPVVAGVVALMLEARPDLTWRDVQHILAISCDQVDPSDSTWMQNAAGYLHSNKYGWGGVNVVNCVNNAITWNGSPDRLPDETRTMSTPVTVDAATTISTLTFDGADGLEADHLIFSIDIDHPRINDLHFTLTAPSGTISTLARRPQSADTDLRIDTTSLPHWCEGLSGNWTLTIYDHGTGAGGTLNSWSLTARTIDLAPKFDPIAPVVMNEDESVTIPFPFYNFQGDSSPIILDATSDNLGLMLPSSLSLSGPANNRELTITPLPNRHGTVTITIAGSDRFGSDSVTIDITVLPVDDNPEAFDLNALTPNTETISSFLSGRDADAPTDSITFGIQSALSPAGAGTFTLINPTTGEFTFVPTPGFTGTATVIFTVTDTMPGATVSATLTIEILDEIILSETRPLIISEPFLSVYQSLDWSYTLNATTDHHDPNLGDLEYFFGSQPSGVVMQNATARSVDLYWQQVDFSPLDHALIKVYVRDENGNIDLQEILIRQVPLPTPDTVSN